MFRRWELETTGHMEATPSTPVFQQVPYRCMEILSMKRNWHFLRRKLPTVDGWNPAPVDMVNTPLFTRIYTSQVVQDFSHQQYFEQATVSALQAKWSKNQCLLVPSRRYPVNIFKTPRILTPQSIGVILRTPKHLKNVIQVQTHPSFLEGPIADS